MRQQGFILSLDSSFRSENGIMGTPACMLPPSVRQMKCAGLVKSYFLYAFSAFMYHRIKQIPLSL